jgi:hypothetical protein
MKDAKRTLVAIEAQHRQGSKIRYELSDNEVLELYYTEPRLAALIEMDVIKLIDRHLVVNLKEFITPKTHHLSAHAKRNKPACCVGIQYVRQNRYSEENEKAIRCTLDIIIQAVDFLESGASAGGIQSDTDQKKEASKIDREIARLNGILKALPGSFSGSLKYHMEKKGYTEELLAQESWVSVSTIKQYRQKEDKEKTLKTVTALCIGMHLHPWLTEDLLRKAGIVPKATKLDGAYRFLYTAHYKDNIEDCNVYLKSQRLPEFKMREKS